jgi:hypothetical protein
MSCREKMETDAMYGKLKPVDRHVLPEEWD